MIRSKVLGLALASFVMSGCAVQPNDCIRKASPYTTQAPTSICPVSKDIVKQSGSANIVSPNTAAENYKKAPFVKNE